DYYCQVYDGSIRVF
nr:immunoglobulin light chain junction region [Macaca mulatta]MOV95285.1 immunoglobulin light chain junction region [Macaca mulatta]MOV95888.1 immunoglobulin light chain junction region [Macaca mulatta]MOV96570.1 immunoglobulin light chain junction region [Macaca mulatta]MOV99504.1 immunoglobulin light chain junction region [Macaca mulatta]